MENKKIFCKCGCNQQFDELDKYGRKRLFIHGHNSKEKDFRLMIGKKLHEKPPWNYGMKMPVEQCKKMSEARKKLHFIPWNKGTKGLMNSWNKGFTKETHPSLLKISKTRMGHVVNDVSRQKISNSLIGRFAGDKNPAWKGGVSFLEYPPEFNGSLKNMIKKNYNHCCVLCNKHIAHNKQHCECLDIHHVDYNKKNNLETNLIPLCHICHSKVHWDRDKWFSLFTNMQPLNTIKECSYL